MSKAVSAERKLGALIARKTHRGPRWTVVELHDGSTRVLPTLSYHIDKKKRTKALPPYTNWGARSAASDAQTYGNTQQGDCVIASALHRVGGWTGNETGTPAMSSDSEALQTYAKICGRGDPGCVITDVLDVAVSTGLPLGGVMHKISGYVAVDWTNKEELQTALAIFGPSVNIGFNLPAAYYDNAAASGFLWDVLSSAQMADIVGGHDVMFGDYGSSGVLLRTWGMIGTLTYAALAQPGLVTECYCSLSPDWTSLGGVAPNGLNVATLTADLTLLGQGTTPPTPGPVTPPTPADGVLIVDPATQTITLPAGWTLARFAAELGRVLVLSEYEYAVIQAIRDGSLNPVVLAEFFAFVLQLLPIIIPLFKYGGSSARIDARRLAAAAIPGAK